MTTIYLMSMHRAAAGDVVAVVIDPAGHPYIGAHLLASSIERSVPSYRGIRGEEDPLPKRSKTAK